MSARPQISISFAFLLHGTREDFLRLHDVLKREAAESYMIMGLGSRERLFVLKESELTSEQKEKFIKKEGEKENGAKGN